jgi:hypothetical protein
LPLSWVIINAYQIDFIDFSFCEMGAETGSIRKFYARSIAPNGSPCSDEDQPNDLAAVNQLAYDYATAPDSPEKEARCLVPAFDGAYFSGAWKGALWDRFYTGAPQRQRRSVERYNIVKRA